MAQRFEFRPGVKGFPSRFRGMNRQIDPAAVPPDQFQHLENVRLIGSGIANRGGQERHVELTGAVRGIFAQQFQFDEGILAPIVGFFLGGYIDDGINVTPTLFTAGEEGIDRSFGFTSHQQNYLDITIPHEGQVYVGGGDNPGSVGSGNANLYAINPTTPINGLQFLAAIAVDQIFTDMLSHTDGELYLATVGTGFSTVWRWDGGNLTGVVEDQPGDTGSLRLGAHEDDLFALFSHATTPKLRRRVVGWSDVTLPAEAVGGFHCTDTLEFDGSLFFLGVNGTGATVLILEWNGTTITTVWSRAIAAFPGSTSFESGGMVEVGGVMYFVYGPTNVAECFIGSRDGAGAFTDEVVDVSAQFPGVTGQSGQPFSFGDSFYLALATETPPPNQRILQTLTSTIGGTYADVTSSILGADEQFGTGQFIRKRPAVRV